VLYANRLAPTRDGLAGAPGGTAGAPAGEKAANRYQDNVFWAVWGKGSGFLSPAGTETARPANLACAETDSSLACVGDPATLYPGASAAQIAVRLREFAKRWEADDPQPGAVPTAVKAILPAAKPAGN
jgi:hypothetical protein